MDFQVIANGIATTLGTVIATNGGETESLVATADLPNQVVKEALLVYPPTGTLELLMGHTNDIYDFPVKLLRDPINMPDRSRWLYAWATVLRPLIQTHFTLGIVGVTDAMWTSMRIEPDGERYASSMNTPGGDPFDVVELIARVWVFELVGAVAP